MLTGRAAGALRLATPGRPAFPDLPLVHVSLSHTAGWVAAVAGVEEAGIDVEAVTSASAERLRGLDVWAPGETAALRGSIDADRLATLLWTRKEALVKLGLASLNGLRAVDTTALGASMPSLAVLDDLTAARASCLLVRSPKAVPELELWS